MERGLFTLAMVCHLVAIASEVGIAYGAKLIYDAITSVPSTSVMPVPLLTFLTAASVRVGCGEVSTYLFAVASDRLQTHLRLKYHADMRRLAVFRSNAAIVADAASVLTSKAFTISTGTIVLWKDVVGSTIHVLMLSGILLVGYGYRSFVAALAVALTSLVPLCFGRHTKKMARDFQSATTQVLSQVQESLAGAQEIIAFSAENWDRDRMSAASQTSQNTSERLMFWQRLSAGISNGGYWFGISIAYVFGAKLVAEGRISAGDCVAFVWLCNLMNQPISQLSRAYTQLQNAAAAFERVHELCGLLDGHKVTSSGITKRPGSFLSVAFENVSFTYTSGTKALDRVSFVVSGDQHVAIVGENGSGKTTIVKLLLGFQHPTGGVIRLNGHDMRELGPDGMRDHVAIVFQDNFLFDTTIFENVSMGASCATEQHVWSALLCSDAKEFVMQLPAKLFSKAGQRGTFFSGGQRQKLAISRALLKNPDLLILDEPTSSIDAANDRKILESILQQRKSKAVIVITHKLTSMEIYDSIFVLHRGRLVAAGTHLKLLNTCSIYRDLFERRSETSNTGDLNALHAIASN